METVEDQLMIEVDPPQHSGYQTKFWFHEKQCRRLKRKQKPREWWIKTNYTRTLVTKEVVALVSEGLREEDGWIHVREVTKK